jgi:hypothetical protein
VNVIESSRRRIPPLSARIRCAAASLPALFAVSLLYSRCDVLQAYVRDAERFWDHASVGLL